MPKRAVDVTGKRFGLLTALHRDPGRPNTTIYWIVRCDCGSERSVRYWELIRYQSCGCKRRQSVRARLLKHGCTSRYENDGRITDEYRIWCAMLTRVRNKSAASAKNYIERGIAVCERWTDFQNFLSDMGARPTKAHSIDRIDNNGNYEPGNCRWATAKEQARNQRTNIFLEFNGRRQCLADWAAELAVPPQTIYSRARAGWPAEEVLFGRRR